MHLSIFFRRLAPYSVCFLRALARRGHQIELIYEPATAAAPFETFDLSFCWRATGDSDDNYRRAWLQQPDSAMPDALLMAGWINQFERAAGRRLRHLGRPVICGIDNHWRGDLRQQIGTLISPWFIRPMANIAWVAGKPQAEFARRLGFPSIAQGVYCADVTAYECSIPLAERESAFLFTGRLVADKGFDLLVTAYSQYHQTVASPLELWVAGTGPMQPLAENQPGLRYLGFVQPQRLPALMAQAQALVLPSRIENWGVVIHEAAASGLPVLASQACNATEAFVRDDSSGFVFDVTVAALREALLKFHYLSTEKKQNMSYCSRQLALSWVPEMQVNAFIELISG